MARVADQRKTALSARKKLSAADRRQASLQASRRLARLPAVRRARRIGLYWPLASEIDPRPLVSLLGSSPPTVCYPRVVGDILRFVPARPASRWRRSALGVREPSGWSYPVNALDVLIMPLAGFDAAAHRIGLGGGFYDRTLAPVRTRPYTSPTRIGLAFECQRLDTIEPQLWDVDLAAVVTEDRVYRPYR
ncbi:5-formyltetrahydrofolate cyclo-ligase [Salinisphaera hydrothermalis]|uniref:5-formyltetrahydrofolate cyclo-ligase n=1 Tax=Salinisphaera hydrothermalis (strain C41B8) TaxID=1304275 RepID=A0A084IKY4_SALHC|nr:5-formyltetrahydrofolate cyclo-ligase [Salinisphaera hydrothermalis]KEZ77368.1 5-formyltetrahydrofolate cyclo-ligase [Salinisphaera hydrothermalis C41B8]